MRSSIMVHLHAIELAACESRFSPAHVPISVFAGRVIHEFDPWFNYRATEYMVANGWEKFQVRMCSCV